jgi:porphobilinogen synthase
LRKAGNIVAFPIHRLRRTRRTAGLRGLVRETELSPSDFIYPIFVTAGEDVRNPISSMPDIFQLSISHAVEEAKRAQALGIPGVLLFGIPDEKDEAASGAYDPEGVVQLATRAIKDALPELLVVTDVCLCEYMSHGHCGVVDRERGEILNDVSVELLARTASSQAEAGADIVAPSDMMDGRVAALRSELDREGHENVPIMAYSAKYASAFYGPFREAAESAPQFGDRRGYQMDPANAREALREVALDIEEGADVIMVKPALPYLDVVRRVRDTTDLPVAAYNVSGEYSMLKAAVQNGWLDEERAVLEALTGIKRAGAEIIISYHAPDVARWLQ